MLDSLQESFQQREIEHRLGDRVLCAGLDFELEAANFFVKVGNTGIRAYSDGETGADADGIAADIQPAIQVVDNVD